MITKYKEYTISQGTAPYTYTWSADRSCVTFSNSSGTTSSTTGTNIYFTDEDCLANSIVTLTIVDAKGCSKSTTVSIPNDCDNLAIVSITQEGEFTFKAIASSSNCSNVTFSWNYDTLLFDLISVTNIGSSSTLKLQPKFGGGYPSTTLIYANVTDCNNCEETEEFILNICSPEVSNVTVPMYCNTNGIFQSGRINFPIPTNCGSTIDWDTILIDLPSGITITEIDDNYISFQGLSSVEEGIYVVEYVVYTTNNIRSTVGTITFAIYPCDNIQAITIPNRVITIDCDEVAPGDTITINVEDEPVTTSGAIIDWSTWTLVDPPTPESPSITLTTDVNGDHIIEYETTNPLVPDVFTWTVCDTDGNCAYNAVYTVLDCPTAPVATNDTDCTVCGGTVIIPVLDNDVDGGTPLVLTSVTTTQPDFGVTVANLDGTITYTAPSDFEGTATFTYTVYNTAGQISNTGTVEVDVACSGENTTRTICIPAEALVNPYDDLNGTKTTGGTWTYTSGPILHPAPPVLYDDDIDFTGFANGTYEYTYTTTCLTCDDTKTMTYTVGSQTPPSNDECATGHPIATPAETPFDDIYGTFDNREFCPGNELPTLSAESIPAQWSLTPAHDLWYTVTVPDPAIEGAYQIYYTVDGSGFGASGIDRPMIAAYSGNTCGGKKFLTAATATNQTATLSFPMISGSSTTWYIRVASESGKEGQFSIRIHSS